MANYQIVVTRQEAEKAAANLARKIGFACTVKTSLDKESGIQTYSLECASEGPNYDEYFFKNIFTQSRVEFSPSRMQSERLVLGELFRRTATIFHPLEIKALAKNKFKFPKVTKENRDDAEFVLREKFEFTHQRLLVTYNSNLTIQITTNQEPQAIISQCVKELERYGAYGTSFEFRGNTMGGAPGDVPNEFYANISIANPFDIHNLARQRNRQNVEQGMFSRHKKKIITALLVMACIVAAGLLASSGIGSFAAGSFAYWLTGASALQTSAVALTAGTFVIGGSTAIECISKSSCCGGSMDEDLFNTPSSYRRMSKGGLLSLSPRSANSSIIPQPLSQQSAASRELSHVANNPVVGLDANRSNKGGSSSAFRR